MSQGRSLGGRVGAWVVPALLAAGGWAHAQLFESLKALGDRLDAGDPEVPSTWEGGKEGPKGIAAGDLDGDLRPDLAVSNLDGTVTVYLNQGDARFSAPIRLRTETRTLRDVLIAELTGDGLADVACASLLDAQVLVFPSLGGGRFAEPVRIPTWYHARNLSCGDFDGDGATDLAVGGPGKGLRQYKRLPDGSFRQVAELARFAAPGNWSAPVYTMRPLRPAGAARDELVATHAWLPEVCVLSAGPGGALEVRACIEVETGVLALEMGPILKPAGPGPPDLVTAHRDLGTVEVRSGIDGPGRFAADPAQSIPIPGGPRSLAIADLDGDGWNDLVVVLRNLDRVLALRNERGTLVPATEIPVGTSPREVAAADFNADGRPDLAVINRLSSDVSILPAYPGQVGFAALDQFYLTDGEVAGLAVRDFNADGRDDVVQLHRASGDISVRLARPDGSLEPPRFYAMGTIPADLVVEDVNGDRILDTVVVNMGGWKEPGSVSVRLGDGQGGLGPERRFVLPDELSGQLFALEVADFNGDDNPDLAAGFFDCRLSFWRGNGDGSFTHTRTQFFLFESRAMAAGDFDQDGDIDLAGAAFTGEVLVLENRGDLLTDDGGPRRSYPPPTPDKFGTQAMIAADLNQDGDLDLVVGSPDGTMLFFGAAGMEFTRSEKDLPGTERVPSSSVASGDFDGDGSTDLAVACEVLSCVLILTKGPGGAYQPALSVDVPAGRLIATGDLDGDGKADLVGSGEVLWTALSSRQARRSGPPVLEGARERIAGLVLNELLAINNQLPLAQDGGRRSDWIEIYNGSAVPAPTAGLRLVLEVPGATPAEYRFPGDQTIPAGRHLLLIAATPGDRPLHTGYRLPGEGGTLRLLDPEGAELDRVSYPAQRENVSYARYGDGLRSWVFSPYPSPAWANRDGGPLRPVASLLAAVPEGLTPLDPVRAPRPGEPIRFFARAGDDVGVVSLSVLWRRAGQAGAAERVILFDDGTNGDGAMQDGLFSGVLRAQLPAAAEIQFHLEAVDLSRSEITVPGGATFYTEGGGEDLYGLAVSGFSAPRIEISEVVARNQSGLRDEGGDTADWVEVRNCSGSAQALDGFFLGDRFPMDEEWFRFPAGTVLPPGEHLVVFCDGNPGQGPLHAPFRLGADSGRVILAATTPTGGRALVDSLDYGPQPPDTALARPHCGGGFIALPPSPGTTPALNGARRGDVDRSGRLDISDPVLILGSLFLGGRLACGEAADADSSGRVDITDPLYLLGHLFLGGPAPAPGAVECR